MTKYDNINAKLANAKIVGALPTTPAAYYSGLVDSLDWVGGELAYLTGQSRLYIQTATSGVTATWKLLADQFATTTSTSTSTSTSTTTSTTSTSTSSSSSTSSSTSTSSTTTP